MSEFGWLGLDSVGPTMPDGTPSTFYPGTGEELDDNLPTVNIPLKVLPLSPYHLASEDQEADSRPEGER